jgi:dTDP-4-amino-4,6-dideoxygalactose transaminase
VKEILEICEDHGLILIEDAAHAHGSEYDGEKAGSFGLGGAFSFYPTKVITSCEGGMITTNNEEIYKKATIFRDQGKAGFHGNVHVELGYNWRMSEIHAVIGLFQLNRLEEFIEKRRKIAEVYNRELKKIDVEILKVPSRARSNYYKYIAFLDEGIERGEVKKALKERFNIGLSGEVYELPCHLQPIFKNAFRFSGGEFPVAEDLCTRHICLPIYPTMTKEEAKYVVDCLGEVIR